MNPFLKHTLSKSPLVLLAFSGLAAAQSVTSVYTSLKAQDCKTLRQETEGEYIQQLCPGVAGLRLEASEGDLRMNIRIKHKDGHLSDLGLMENVSAGFSRVSDKAEWRMKQGQPIALILRYNVSENPEDASIITSYLVVSKVSAKQACVVAVLPPSNNANAVARVIADGASGVPCFGRK